MVMCKEGLPSLHLEECPDGHSSKCERSRECLVCVGKRKESALPGVLSERLVRA